MTKKNAKRNLPKLPGASVPVAAVEDTQIKQSFGKNDFFLFTTKSKKYSNCCKYYLVHLLLKKTSQQQIEYTFGRWSFYFMVFLSKNMLLAVICVEKLCCLLKIICFCNKKKSCFRQVLILTEKHCMKKILCLWVLKITCTRTWTNISNSKAILQV